MRRRGAAQSGGFAPAAPHGDRVSVLDGAAGQNRKGDPMKGGEQMQASKNNGAPQVLIASVSRHEGRALEASLERHGCSVLMVDDADHAARELDHGGHLGVLVIDAGLLEMTHDAQWRVLATRHPQLGLVVRCLAPRREQPRRGIITRFEVHPDDVETICWAVGCFG